MDINVIGKKLKKIRKLAGISRDNIEKEHGISQSTIRNWEMNVSNNVDIPLLKLVKYLKILENYGLTISIEELLSDSTNCWIEKSTPRDLITVHDTNSRNHKNLANTNSEQLLMSSNSNLLFYSTVSGKILYISQLLKQLLGKKSGCITFKDSLFISDIAPGVDVSDYMISGSTNEHKQDVIKMIVSGTTLLLKLVPTYLTNPEIITGFMAIRLNP